MFDSVCTIYTFPNGVNMTFESVISNKHYGMGEQILCKDATIDLVMGRLYAENPKRRSGIRQLVGEIEQGIFSSSPLPGRAGLRKTPLQIRESQSCRKLSRGMVRRR